MRTIILLALLMLIAACSGHKPLQAGVADVGGTVAPQAVPDAAPATPVAPVAPAAPAAPAADVVTTLSADVPATPPPADAPTQ